MPVIDGFVLLHTLSSKPGPNRETPIYVITADTSDGARLKALKHRALFMLTKPVPIVTLVGLVSQTLKKAPQTSAFSPLELHNNASLRPETRTDVSKPPPRPLSSVPSGPSPSGTPKKPGS
jgi:DNA-binding response OmpR family regulator